MKFLKKLFNKRIKMLGRAGIIYNDSSDKYFINSECLVTPPTDVVLFSNEITYFDKSKKHIQLSEEKKKTIAILVKSELESMGMIVELA